MQLRCYTLNTGYKLGLSVCSLHLQGGPVKVRRLSVLFTLKCVGCFNGVTIIVQEVLLYFIHVVHETLFGESAMS